MARVEMINELTGMAMSVPEELVAAYKMAGHKLAAETAKAEEFAVPPDTGSEPPDTVSEPPDTGSETEKKKQQKK